MSGLSSLIAGPYQRIRRDVGHAQRFRTIVSVFLKYGYEDLARQLPVPRFWFWLATRRTCREQDSLIGLSRPERLRRALEELGPTFVKFGQLLAGRTRLLPRAYTDELNKLHDQVPPVPFSEVTEVIASELGHSPGESFVRIEETPLGSASIAQVHRAWLPTGGEAVIKVQRPEIDHLVRTDLEIMARIADRLERKVDEWRPHQPTAIVADFARRVEQEMDFSTEIAGMERFALQFKDDPTVRVPKVYRTLSTGRLLTMERVDGIPATRLDALRAAGIDLPEVARRIGDLTLNQIFVHGFFHADPHPGNLHILPGNVVCFLDFGMTGFLSRETRETLAALLVAVARRDERGGTNALLQLAGAELDSPRPGLESDVAEFIHRHFTGTVRDLSLLRHLLQLTSRHSLTLPPEVFLVVKALGQVEHVVRALAPDFDLLDRARPFMREINVRRAHPRRVMRELLYFGGDAMAAVRTLPLEFRRMAAQLREGKLKVNVNAEVSRSLNETVERITYRLAFAVVLAALIIASAIVVHAGVAPRWHGISIIGLIGYSFAGLMSMMMLILMVRRGRM